MRLNIIKNIMRLNKMKKLTIMKPKPKLKKPVTIKSTDSCKSFCDREFFCIPNYIILFSCYNNFYFLSIKDRKNIFR